MKCNVAIWDRSIRFFLGVVLTTYAIAGGPFWSYIGLYGLVTAAWGLCPVYAFFRIRTLRTFSRARLDKE